MTSDTPRIGRVTFDAATHRYAADVTYSDADGLLTMHVRTPGHPAWGHARTLQALQEAGARARALQHR